VAIGWSDGGKGVDLGRRIGRAVKKVCFFIKINVYYIV
jgi:hypothetical protein